MVTLNKTMQHKRWKTFLLISSGIFISNMSVYAQQFEEAASIEFGSFEFIPMLDLALEYDDNLTQSAGNKVDSWSRTISPQFDLQSNHAGNQVNIGYRLRNQDFFSSSPDNYTDHFLVTNIDLELGARHRLQTSLEFEDGHDQRGSGFSIGTGRTLSQPDQYKQTEFDTKYSYGAFNSDGRLEAYFNTRDLDYDISTLRYRARDRQIATLGGTFYYRVGATTDLTFDLRRSKVDYKFAFDTSNPLDSVVHEYLVGLKWEATAKTSGFAKIGYEEKDFHSAQREDFTGFDWSAGVLWEPLEYSSVEFVTRSDTDETNGEGNFIRGRSHSIEWLHEWRERMRTGALITWNNNRYEGQLIDGFSIRSDENLSVQGSLFYQFRRWINIEARYRYSQRDSNRNQINYDRNQFSVNVHLTL